MLWRISASSGAVLAERARWPKTGRERRKGLLGTTSLDQGDGIILERAYQIHTFGMAYAIDVAFCSKDWRVLHVVHSMPPGRLSRFVFRGFYAIEVPVGAAAVERGDRLEVTQAG